MKRKIGIDLGGSNVAAALVGDGGEILYRYAAKTDRGSAASVIRGLADAVVGIERACSLSNDDIGSIGVACPGSVDRDRGVVDFSANLPFSGDDVAGGLSSLTGVDRGRIKLSNDADAAALGEYHFGAGRGVREFLMITIGTGIGSGYINDGKILTGFNHAGGELGHTVIVYDGEPCACGRRGCAEQYCSAPALARQTRAAVAESEAAGVHTVMSDIAARDGKFSARTPFRAAELGDEAAVAVVDRYVSYLACAIANFINIFQPEVLAVGGGVSNEGERLLAPLRDRVDAEIYGNGASGARTRIVRAALGNDAGIVGAAML